MSEPIVKAKKTIHNSLPLQPPIYTELISTSEEQEEAEQLFYRFLIQDQAQRIAASILEGSTDNCAEALRDLIWRLIYEEKLGLAFHLAQCVEILYKDAYPTLPSWLIRALTLGPAVRFDVGEVSGLLEKDLANFSENCFVPGQSEWNHSIRFLLATAALRPSLLAPNTGASAILHSLWMKDRLEHLFNYCKAIAKYGDQHQALDPVAIRKVRDQAVWQSELQALSKEVDDWWILAPQLDMIFSPAKKVWLKWLERDNLIYSLLLPVRQDDQSKLQSAKQDIAQLWHDSQIDREVNRSDRILRGRRAADGIKGKPLGRLRMHVREAVAFVRRWIELRESSPDQNKSFLQVQAEQLREEVWNRHEAVMEELDDFEKRNGTSLFILSGIHSCRRAIENIRILFDPDSPLPSEEPNPKYILHSELLKVPSLPMNEEWEPVIKDPAQVIEQILRHISSGNTNWEQAFKGRIEARDHESTLCILEYLRAHSEPGLNLDHLQSERQKSLMECQDALHQDIEYTRKEIESAVAFGLVTEKERADFIGKLQEIDLAIGETLRFYSDHGKLSAIRNEIASKRTAEIQSVRQRVETLSIGLEDESYARINSALEKGDILTANEYIDMLLSHIMLPEEDFESNSFFSFFPDRFREITSYLESPATRPDKIVDGLRNYARGRHLNFSLGPISMKRVAGPQAAQAADMLETWFTAKRTQKIDADGIKKILNTIGFNTLGCRQGSSRVGKMFEVETEPLRERNKCPVPAFGSQTNGRYRILCVWERPTEEDMLNDIGDTLHGTAAIVFYFGRMTEQRRRDLAHLCVERRRTFIVIDDVLILYLSGERGSRLPVLFDCALPFCFSEPYTTTAGLVPPEMFYGRRRERDSIIAPTGSCFIYGGRQLGKTVLFRDVERAFNAPRAGKIALWLDLKSQGIGYNRSVDEIWQLLAVEFKKLSIVPDSMPNHAGVDTLLNHIQDWLSKDEQRRILLLLDESDRFLEIDGTSEKGKGEYIRAAQLKGLMDRTGRRFKVVFAGLHNVQRTTRLENHPLAHYGEPICIGPLLDNGEMREARYLIERPLASLGYRFESPDLVTRILSQTNYYPSLIQLYCHYLLRHVTGPDQILFDAKVSPPYTITSQQVEDAYQSQELRKAIRDRFMWTLDLDPRYRVIAFSIALYSIPTSERRNEDGFAVSWIREQALTWWKQGFQHISSEDAFRVLLDEMVGLGVLRLVGGSRYKLRSPNVILLLGTKGQIESELESCSAYELPLQYEATTFRTALGNDSSRRSPLTAQQESELRSRKNGVSIIFGNEAAGLNEINMFLEYAQGKEFLIHIDDCLDRGGFARRLAEFSKRESDGTTLMLVSSNCPWNEQWIEDAIRSVNKLKSRTKFARVVFVADPQAAWQLMGSGADGFQSLMEKEVTPFSLRPWHDTALQHWLDDCGFPSDKQKRNAISDITGNWPLLLRRYYQSCKTNLQQRERQLQILQHSISDADDAIKFAQSLGLDLREPRRVLRDLAILGEATEEDLIGIVQDIPPEIVRSTLRWADFLGLASPEGNGIWQVDRVVSRILKTLQE
jgi:hypothetical protein